MSRARERIAGRLDRREPLLWIVAAGALVRLVYAAVYPPVWKLSAAFNVFELGLVAYVADFASYKPSRMPFFDVLAAASYAVFSPLLGLKGLLVATVVLAVVAIAAFYLAVESLYGERVATPAAVLFALYPKFVTLTSTGLAEAASISFLALALYAFVHARETDRLREYATAGFLAASSFAMFTPAVAAGVLLAALLYLEGVRTRLADRSVARALLPSDRLAAYSAIPGVFGVVYLWVGPVSELLADVSADRLSVFVDPAAHSLASKVFWYLAYSFFDFWWHTRGFDRERGIRPLLNSLEGFLGPAFPVYMLGWAAIALGLSLLVGVGIVRLLDRRRAVDVLLLAWIAVYVLAYNYKNLGFVGGFQTRHVSAVFPALCIAFGLGAVAVAGWIRSRDPGLPGGISPRAVVGVLVVLGLAVLLVNGVGQGAIEGEKRSEAVAEPVADVTEIAAGESVAALRGRDFHNLVLYSENRVRPVLLSDSVEERTDLRARFGTTAEIRRVEDDTLRDADVRYLYLRVEPAYVDRIPYTVDLTGERIDRLLSAHEVVYHETVPDGPFRTTSVEIYLLELDPGERQP